MKKIEPYVTADSEYVKYLLEEKKKIDVEIADKEKELLEELERIKRRNARRTSILDA